MSLDKENLDKLLKEEGETKGVVFETDRIFVIKKAGEEGLRKVEEKIKELGYPIDYRNPRTEEWIPVGLRIISLLVIKDVLGFDDATIREMGRSAPNVSTFIRFFLHHLFSVKKILDMAPSLWSKHFRNFGEAENIKADEEGRETILRLKGAKGHPIFHLYLEGYFEKVVSLGIKGKNIKTKETKCIFRGDPYCEYTTHWDPL
jgi:predicted hydrocarbon binding protein